MRHQCCTLQLNELTLSLVKKTEIHINYCVPSCINILLPNSKRMNNFKLSDATTQNMGHLPKCKAKAVFSKEMYLS